MPTLPLPQIREALLQGNNLQAQQLMYQHFACGGHGSAYGQGKDAYGSFQLLGHLQLSSTYSHHRSYHPLPARAFVATCGSHRNLYQRRYRVPPRVFCLAW